MGKLISIDDKTKWITAGVRSLGSLRPVWLSRRGGEEEEEKEERSQRQGSYTKRAAPATEKNSGFFLRVWSVKNHPTAQRGSLGDPGRRTPTPAQRPITPAQRPITARERAGATAGPPAPGHRRGPGPASLRPGGSFSPSLRGHGLLFPGETEQGEVLAKPGRRARGSRARPLRGGGGGVGAGSPGPRTPRRAQGQFRLLKGRLRNPRLVKIRRELLSRGCPKTPPCSVKSLGKWFAKKSSPDRGRSDKWAARIPSRNGCRTS
ncbi:bcl-2-binding component 3, isoforms 3/4-like [Vulpes lagopus]|uniref:bcl-2-binding component 3, isoforms 3/4-like n=1 Tax=Vulpes lagopus TaxID=494514 RepID=UPI001BC9727A|nr:bcl-2-binding component 3, isoforms 3/4-like [Vulpes lagopus]